MMRYFPAILFFLFTGMAHAQSLSGIEIMKEQELRNTGYRDEKSIGQMLLIGSHGEKTEREFEFRKLEKSGAGGDGEAASVARSSRIPGGDKSLIKFIKPVDIQRTGLLSYQNKNRNDDQWLFLPAMGKTKRISGAGKSGSFVGSEFSYEDLIPPDIDKYDYRFVKQESFGGSDCFVVESRPRFTDSAYSKTVSWIRTDNYQTVKTDFYDLKERPLKTALFENLTLTNNRFWRPLKISVKNHQNNKQTDLTISALSLDNGFKGDDFTQMALER
ncbi:MAG: outer membrane lipoprotein-sorting protein [Deltaproteobacteria bacterium]|nr:outer membrane lipoprotein-sorting protein [Deltaproteobacteria bacterium]